MLWHESCNVNYSFSQNCVRMYLAIVFRLQGKVYVRLTEECSWGGVGGLSGAADPGGCV